MGATRVDPAERFRLSVPSEPLHVSTARIFVAAVARAFAADEDTVEDVKVGISEACSMSLRDAPGGGELSIAAAAEAGRLRFEVDGEVSAGWLERGRTEDTPTPTSIATILSREVLTALFDDAQVEHAGDRGTIRFSVALQSDA